MRDWVRARLNEYESRQERRDDEFSSVVIGAVDGLGNRQTLLRSIGLLAGLNLFYWASVLIFPFAVLEAFERVSAVSNKIDATVLAIVFGTGLWLTYALFRLKSPDLESSTPHEGPMSAYDDQQRSHRRVRIWVMSVVGGLLNLLALSLAELLRLG